MTLKELLEVVPEGQWVVLTITLKFQEVYGFYYRKGLEQFPNDYLDKYVFFIKGSANKTLEVVI